MPEFAIALLDGLSYASTLFLIASGLTLVDWFAAWADSLWLYALTMLPGACVAGALAWRRPSKWRKPLMLSVLHNV